MLYSLKMRASQSKDGKNQHISGAERILQEEDLKSNVDALINRALHHSKGKPDFLNIKIETINNEELKYVEALPVSTFEVSTADEGQKHIIDCLSRIGITNAAEIMTLFSKTYNMRGAMLLNVDTLERLEPNHERGIRATFMDAANSAANTNDGKNHFREALVLASKVVNAPGIVAEICMSDDPNYVTGYVAAPSIGYVRITKLKELGCPDGGRIFLYRGKNEDVSKCIEYLEHQKVLVKNIPSTPIKVETGQQNIWQPLQNTIENLKENQLYRTMHTITSSQNAHITTDNREFILLASNNYLGLNDDERVKNAAKAAIDEFGSGSGGSRLTTGNLILHEELERDLADFKGTDNAILFNTGYMANVGTISALCNKDSVIFSDELNHASIIDGCRLSRAKVVIYKHNDINDLERKIKEHKNFIDGLIVSDAVFSMDGDIANLPDIMSIARKHNLMVMVDEAHSTGVIGANGHGIVEHFNLSDKPDVLMGTLSKSLASEGGFVCGNNLLIDYLRNKARSFIFSTSLAPATLASAKAALQILRTEPERVTQLQKNVKYFCAQLKNCEINVNSESAIIPIVIGNEEEAMKISAKLFDAGIYISAIRYPTVAKGQARLRAAIMATHTEQDLKFAAQKISFAKQQVTSS